MWTLRGPLTAYLAVAADFLGLAMILPALPFFVSERGEDPSWLGAILTAQYAGVVVGSILFGYLSDKMGRLEAVLLALAGDAVMFAVSGFADSALALFVIRLIAGTSTPISCSVAYLVDHVSEKERPKAMSLLSAALIGGFLVGSAGASAMANAGFMAVCLTSSGIAFAALLAIWLGNRDAASPAAGEGPDAAAGDNGESLHSEGDDSHTPTLAEMARRRSASSDAAKVAVSGFSRRDLTAAVESPSDGTKGTGADGDADTGAGTAPSTPMAQDDAAAGAVDVFTVGETMKSRYFAPIAMSSFLTGWSFAFNVTLAPLIVTSVFEFNQQQVSFIFLGIVVELLMVNLLLYAPLVRAVGIKYVIAVSLGVTSVFVGLAPTAVDSENLVFILIVFSFIAVNNAIVRPSVNVLSANTAKNLVPSGIGRIMGANQGLFSIGQAVAPIVTASLYSFGGATAAFVPTACVFFLNFCAMLWFGARVNDTLPEFAAARRAELLEKAAATDPEAALPMVKAGGADGGDSGIGALDGGGGGGGGDAAELAPLTAADVIVEDAEETADDTAAADDDASEGADGAADDAGDDVGAGSGDLPSGANGAPTTGVKAEGAASAPDRSGDDAATAVAGGASAAESDSASPASTASATASAGAAEGVDGTAASVGKAAEEATVASATPA